VVAAPDGTELHARDAGTLEEDDVGGAVTADAHRVAAEVPRRDLAQRFHERVVARDVGRFVREENLRLGGEVYGADLSGNLPWVLLG
jgi:hypothetical protein